MADLDRMVRLGDVINIIKGVQDDVTAAYDAKQADINDCATIDNVIERKALHHEKQILTTLMFKLLS